MATATLSDSTPTIGIATVRFAAAASWGETPAASFPTTIASPESPLRRMTGWPVAPVAQTGIPMPARKRRVSSVPAANALCMKRAPIADRTTLGFQRSAVPGSATVAATPNAVAVLRIVPTFPGSCTPSSTSTIPLGSMLSNDRSGRSAMASIPCGLSVSQAEASSASLTSERSNPRSAAMALAWRSSDDPRSVSRIPGERRTDRTRSGEVRSSSTQRTPSARNSPVRSRARLRWRSRATVSGFTSASLGLVGVFAWNSFCL